MNNYALRCSERDTWDFPPSQPCTCNISQGLMRAAVPGLDGSELSKALILQQTSNGGLAAMMDRQRSWPREAHSRRPFSPSLFR